MRHASSNVNSAKVLWATLLACCLQAGLMLVVAADKGDFRKEDDHPQVKTLTLVLPPFLTIHHCGRHRMEAKSDNVRRSKRLQAKKAARQVAGESRLQFADVEENRQKTPKDMEDEEKNLIKETKSESIRSRSSIASRKRRAKIETAIEKKKLEQEMLDLQLALKLEKIEENDYYSSVSHSESVLIHESVKPKVGEWMAVQLPWDYQHPNWNVRDRLNEARGKRDEIHGYSKMYRDGWGDLHGSWGVRNLPSGVEQRTFSSIPIAEKRSWNNLQGGWGKRNTDDEDEAIQEVSPRLVQHRRSIPVESENDEFNLRDMDKRNWNKFTDGWGKRSKWDNFKGTWGKREPAWSNLKGIWGKRSERKQFFDN